MPTLILLALAACGGPSNPEAAPPTAERAAPAEKEASASAAPVPAHIAAMFAPVAPIPVAAEDRDLVELGRMLYYDPRLSVGRDISCNSCHQLENYGVDGEPTSPGHKGQRGDRNSPTVYHAFGHVAQFWDGRAADVEAQAKGPILNPIEMAMPSEERVVALLGSIPGYQTAFANAFPSDGSPVTYDNLAKAIGAFERHLVTPSSFDAFLGGKADALTPEQRHGLDVFVATGCTACHSGQNLGGQMYAKLGQAVPYPTEDPGRGKVTGQDADAHFFKVPSLRNIEKTGPWFHDGSISSLDEAVKLMAKHQLGKDLSDEDTSAIVTFLGSLTGEIDQTYIASPQLPPDGPTN